jgi:hypothetical protein
MPNYPEPALNPACQCRGNPMRAFMCMTGHMLECHYPHSCSQAGCSHLARYDFEPDEVAELEAIALDRLEKGQLPPYGLDGQGNVIVTTNTQDAQEKA